MVGWQAISRPENGWLLPVQFCRGTARGLSANKNTEPDTANDSVWIQGRAAEIEDVSEAVRGLCKSAALHDCETARNISRSTEVACQGPAVAGGNGNVAIARKLDDESQHRACPCEKRSRRHCSRSVAVALAGQCLWITSSIAGAVHRSPTKPSGDHGKSGFSTASGTTSSQARRADGSKRSNTGLSHNIQARLHGFVQPARPIKTGLDNFIQPGRHTKAWLYHLVQFGGHHTETWLDRVIQSTRHT